MDSYTVFLLPFAGGSSYSYKEFKDLGEKRISFIPIELPGRGARLREPLIGDLELLGLDVLNSIRRKINVPYAIYGHSMGSLLGYHLVHLILKNGLPAPNHLFFTGRGGPSIPDNENPRYLMSKEELTSELRRLGGVPDELLQTPLLMDFFEPILRSDFKAVETYNYQSLPMLDIPMTVAYGAEEDITSDEIKAWQLECARPVEFIQFPGGHFFIFERAAEIVSMIADRLDIHTVKAKS